MAGDTVNSDVFGRCGESFQFPNNVNWRSDRILTINSAYREDMPMEIKLVSQILNP